MGAVEEIHERERELIKELAKRIIRYLHDQEGGMTLENPAEREWGEIRFRVRVRHAPIHVTLKIDA